MTCFFSFAPPSEAVEVEAAAEPFLLLVFVLGLARVDGVGVATGGEGSPSDFVPDEPAVEAVGGSPFRDKSGRDAEGEAASVFVSAVRGLTARAAAAAPEGVDEEEEEYDEEEEGIEREWVETDLDGLARSAFLNAAAARASAIDSFCLDSADGFSCAKLDGVRLDDTAPPESFFSFFSFFSV